MADKLRALCYINQFYAGIGGEDKADIGISLFEGAKGPSIGMQAMWRQEMEVVATIACGDNFANTEASLPELAAALAEAVGKFKPHVFISGPAFNAGRYGVACARTADYVRSELGIPSVTAMYPENPAVPMFVKHNYIVATPETAAGMTRALPPLAALALKLAQGKPIGAAPDEGYIPTGHRRNELHQLSGAIRAVNMLMARLNNAPFVTEIPIRTFETVPAAPRIADAASSVVALITTGGLVPEGNPDRLRQAFSTTYGSYSLAHLSTMPTGDYESIHGGYDTTMVNADPNRLVPLDALRQLEAEGAVGGVWDVFLATCGIGTNVSSSVSIGQRMAAQIKQAGVRAAILTST